MILLNDTKMPWFGSRTGYEVLAEHLRMHDGYCVIGGTGSMSNRLLGKTASLLLRHGRTNQAASGRRVAAFAAMLSGGDFLHMFYGENHLPQWGDYPRLVREHTVMTVHQPLSQWSTDRLSVLARFPHVILLSSREEKEFARFMNPKATVSVIRHGVDTEFFIPGIPSRPPRLLYNGVHLRNVGMFVRVVKKLLALYPGVFIDALVPSSRRKGPDFEDLASLPNVVWHEGLDDAGLLSLYQRSYLLLLPMNDSGANTAVVEAIACGLPVVTTDVGGIRDYGGGTIFPVVRNDDDVAMAHLVSRYLEDSHFRKKVSDESRQFALEHLAWPLITSLHRQLYNRLRP
jgi:glycosyltransferase involved in cell wall biosynthesis